MSDALDARGTAVMTPDSPAGGEPRHSSPFTPAQGVPYLSTPNAPTVAPDEFVDESFDDVEATVDRTGQMTDRRFPVPPERASLDDDDLVPLVARHTTDTATIDLIAVLQAQLQLRATEAANFAAWEDRMRRIGTDEALGELERTRLSFTDVIPVQSPPPMITITQAPLSVTARHEPLSATGTTTEAPVVSLTSIPSSVVPASTAPSTRVEAALRDADLLERDPEAPRAAPADEIAAAHSTRVAPRAAQVSSRRSAHRALGVILVVAAAVVIALAFVLTLASGPTGLTAGVAAVGVAAAGLIGVVAGRFALPTGSGRRVAVAAGTHSTLAPIVGLVAGTAVGEGIVVSSATGFGWQGYLSRLIEAQGLTEPVSLVVATVAAFVVAFVITVAADRVARAVNDSSSDLLH